MSEWREVSLHETTMQQILECILNEDTEYNFENKWCNETELWRLFRMIKEDLIINEVIVPLKPNED